LKLLPPDKGREARVGEKKERMVGKGQGMKGKEGKRTSECSHSSTFATTPLIVYSVKKYKKFLVPQNLLLLVPQSVLQKNSQTLNRQTTTNKQTKAITQAPWQKLLDMFYTRHS